MIKQTQYCGICHKSYEGFGNNGWPITNDKCCDECNTQKVIPARLNRIKAEIKAETIIKGRKRTEDVVFNNKVNEIMSNRIRTNKSINVKSIDVEIYEKVIIMMNYYGFTTYSQFFRYVTMKEWHKLKNEKVI